MGRDEQLALELLDTKAQHERELQNHERILNTIMAELEANREAREGQESYIDELKEALTSLMCQVNSKCSNPTPEPSIGAGGGGGGRPRPRMNEAAGRSPDTGDSDEDGSGDEGGARRNNKPAKRNKKPAEKDKTDGEKYGQATEDEIRFSRALGNAIGEITKRPAQPPSEYQHAKHQDIRF